MQSNLSANKTVRSMQFYYLRIKQSLSVNMLQIHYFSELFFQANYKPDILSNSNKWKEQN